MIIVIHWRSRPVKDARRLKIYSEMQKGISIDHRPIAQRGDIEAPRWLIEQSVAITYHRYGNPNGGPKPICEGLSK